VDAVIRIGDSIVLIDRKNPPFGWALPGGFVEVGERVEDAVAREAREETGLLIRDLWLVGVYSEPLRDPRFHTVSVVFGATAEGIPQGGDDAANAVLFKLDRLPQNIIFDHGKIITDYLAREHAKSMYLVRTGS
jgi:8-oxo-dGTP diphosphatase